MKPKYRYNNKTGKLDEVFRVENKVFEILGGRNPITGMHYISTIKPSITINEHG